MSILIVVWSGLLGLVMGSFLNATATRWGTNRIKTKRSKCFSCGITLREINLIPVFSWLWQRGRCASCRSRLPIRLVVIELLTSVVFVGVALTAANFFELLVWLVISSILILITLIDFDQFIIPHELSIPLALLSFGLLFFSLDTWQPTYPTLWQILIGPILASFFWGLWLLTRGRGMGFADGTLSLSIGWLLGVQLGISAILLAFWIGTIFSLLLIAVQRLNGDANGLGLKSAIPFGPYLIAGLLLVKIFNFNLIDLLYF